MFVCGSVFKRSVFTACVRPLRDVYACVCVQVYCAFVCDFVCMELYVNVCVCICVYICVSVCFCAFV